MADGGLQIELAATPEPRKSEVGSRVLSNPSIGTSAARGCHVSRACRSLIAVRRFGGSAIRRLSWLPPVSTKAIRYRVSLPRKTSSWTSTPPLGQLAQGAGCG